MKKKTPGSVKRLRSYGKKLSDMAANQLSQVRKMPRGSARRKSMADHIKRVRKTLST